MMKVILKFKKGGFPICGSCGSSLIFKPYKRVKDMERIYRFKVPAGYVFCLAKCILCGHESDAIVERGHNKISEVTV